MSRLVRVTLVAFLGLCALSLVDLAAETDAPFSWMRPDKFDYINDMFSAVTGENCRSKPAEQLNLPRETIAQIPKYNNLLSTVIYSNRSAMLHMHNMALNRAFFYSFIYQKLNNTWDFLNQPGLQYYYMSAAADVSASPGFLNGSALYFDFNCSYPNWFRTYPFNNTIPFFGPRAWRADDYNEPTNFLREPTNNTMDIHDYGAGRDSNYSNSAYKTNPWYSFWMPDKTGETDSLRKFTYSVGIKYSNTTGHFISDEFEDTSFFGPPQPSQTDGDQSLPVLFTSPYFDCGRSNKWIVSATAPVVEYFPRYSRYIHLRRPRFVAVSTMDTEFERIDMNQCPQAEGNPPPNYFAGTDRCKGTTMCEPISGYGFKRGGYQCVCQPGYYYPWFHDGPFLGWEIEEAARDEYEVGFDCIAVDERQVIPNVMPEFVERKKRSVLSKKTEFLEMTLPKAQSPRPSPRQKRHLVARLKDYKEKLLREKRSKLVARTKRDTSRKIHRNKRDAVDEIAANRFENILQRMYQTKPENCQSKQAHELYLPGDAGHGVEKLFEAQGRTALRLAHFLSNFLQNVDEYEEFGNLRGDRRLNETHIFAEVIANVMSDFKIKGSGVFFDRYKFRMSPPVNNTDPRFTDGITREFFGPYAYKLELKDEGLDYYKAIDFAGFKDYYVDASWYRDMKARWATNQYGLKKFTAKPMIRSNPMGTSLIRFEYYPLTYRAPRYEDGEWLRPQFKCDGMVNDWVVTYVVPFFGKNSLKTEIEFKGVVTVEAKLDYLDINQCPAEFHSANSFKNTARCHFESQYCVPLEGKRFTRGGYKCECRQGYEYPFNDLAWFFDGQTMEEEWRKLSAGEPNRYATLKCRIAGASSVSASMVMTLILACAVSVWTRT
ncbi:uncharacterized protein [Haliotis cracherodii]|uniref:uncharacterized protein n=1 Tax=Haliotis cracherodii TaxID=6455 RepID=UPI0039E99EE7